MVVEVSELKEHLRVQHSDEDGLMLRLLTQAQQAASDYCHGTLDQYIAGEGCAPEPVRLAILLFASHFYENRDASDGPAYNNMMRAFHTLLYPYRDLDKMF